jgi:hypothetical protein
LRCIRDQRRQRQPAAAHPDSQQADPHAADLWSRWAETAPLRSAGEADRHPVQRRAAARVL